MAGMLIAPAARTSDGRQSSSANARATSRAVTTPTARPAASTIGTNPPWESRIFATTADRVASAEQNAGLACITFSTFMATFLAAPSGAHQRTLSARSTRLNFQRSLRLQRIRMLRIPRQSHYAASDTAERNARD
jgi:hypothetical protein